ncbi:hypothetical protein J6590_097594 [Homalodisca vitripennis]|nr:hypothetical protein J6590_097594 [Homalodisca vitripennis]
MNTFILLGTKRPGLSTEQREFDSMSLHLCESLMCTDAVPHRRDVWRSICAPTTAQAAHRTLKSGELSWRCLGKSCGASIKTDENITRVTVCNSKHSGVHPVTMRYLLSPHRNTRAVATTPSTAPPGPDTPRSGSSTASASTSVPDTPPALDTPCTPCTGPVYSTPGQVSVLTVTPSGGLPSGSPDDLVEEIFILRKEIERLKNEYQGLLNHTIESDTRLLQFTDEIFTVNNSPRVNQIVRASATVDCGVLCELPLDPPLEPACPTVDFGAQCDLSQNPVSSVVCRCADSTELLSEFKTTIEVLEAENQCIKNQLQTCECMVSSCSQMWSQVKTKKPAYPGNIQNKSSLQSPNKINSLPAHKYIETNVPTIITTERRHKINNKNRHFFKTSIPNSKTIIINGDSHTRHITGLVRELTDSATSIGGVCMPGARLLDIIKLNQSSPGPGPGPRCEVLIAGTNDLAVGAQRNIYRHLEGFIAARQADAEFVIATLPHRHDLHPDLPVHDDTVLVNAYIEELAARYNARVLNLGGIGRKFFTRHGQHLTMRGKRLLARMIVRIASERPLKTAGAPGLAITTVSSSPTISQVPAAVNPQHQHSGRLQHISYAEALRKYPVLDSDDKSGSAAAVPRGVSGAQAASMSPGGGVLAGATEASEYISPTIRQTDSQSTFLVSPRFGKGLS